MANSEQVALLWSGVDAWNRWRRDHVDVDVDLIEADLAGLDLPLADLARVSLNRADLSHSDLSGALFNQSDLARADLSGANLTGADLTRTNLAGGVNLTGALLTGAIFTDATLSRAVFGDTDLSSATGLETCQHYGPSVVDYQTLGRSGTLPLAFLRGVGLSDLVIEYLPSLCGEAIQFYACFISFSAKDHGFADRLHADLQNKGVRCWFAPHDLAIGAKTRPAIDEAIREADKLLLVLSEHSVKSAWVEHEIERALAKELRTLKVVLFPVRLDDAIKSSTATWAQEIYEDRNVGDMRQWKDHDAYRKAFERLLRDLRQEGASPKPSG
jgi:uncharacterized protein YjbI with pentapeptide repeats